MSLNVKDTGGSGDFKIVEAGTHTAVCTQIVDVGPQETPFGQKELVFLRFEIPSERVEWTDASGNPKEGPSVIWTNYTASLSEKANLRKHLESWRGKKFTQEELGGFDMKNLLGVPCTLSVVHNEAKNGRTYANISSISGLMKGMAKPEPEGDVFAFDIEYHSSAELGELPEWLRNKVETGLRLMKEQRGFRNAPQDEPPPTREGMVDDDFDDKDIPF